MNNRRILSLHLPRLAAERVCRREQFDAPLAIVEKRQNKQIIASLCAQAEVLGLYTGQSLSDAQSLADGLITRASDPHADALFLNAITRWAGQFSPWVSSDLPGDLFLDITGCSHLFGGEAALRDRMVSELHSLGLTAQIGIADTPGAAWALARFRNADPAYLLTGDAIDQEARATRSRAAKRKAAVSSRNAVTKLPKELPPIAPIGQSLQAIGPLPLAALRLDGETCIGLNRLGLNTIFDLARLPRNSVTRRFGAQVLNRLDQALGAKPEPIAPKAPMKRFATRISFPDPIGLTGDIEAGLRRLLEPLCDKLAHAGLGARCFELTCYRADHTAQIVEVLLARPSADPARALPLFDLHIPQIDPHFGIDMMRLEAKAYEPMHPEQPSVSIGASQATSNGDLHHDVIGRLGVRLGIEAITLASPSDSHLPEKAYIETSATLSHPPKNWSRIKAPRPLVMITPEPIVVQDAFTPPQEFKWRRRRYKTLSYQGFERFEPEWWFDLEGWRDGPRDYWTVISDCGAKLWLYQSVGAAKRGGWYCHGLFD